MDHTAAPVNSNRSYKCPSCKTRVFCKDYKEHSTVCYKNLLTPYVFCLECREENIRYKNGRHLTEIKINSFKKHLLSKIHNKDFSDLPPVDGSPILLQKLSKNEGSIVDSINLVSEDEFVEGLNDVDVVQREDTNDEIMEDDDLILKDSEVVKLFFIKTGLTLDQARKIHKSDDPEFKLLDLLLEHYRFVLSNYMTDKAIKYSENLLTYTLSKYGGDSVLPVISKFMEQSASRIRPSINLIETVGKSTNYDLVLVQTDLDAEKDSEEMSNISGVDNSISIIDDTANDEPSVKRAKPATKEDPLAVCQDHANWFANILNQDKFNSGLIRYTGFLKREENRSRLYYGDLKSILEAQLEYFNIILDDNTNEIPIDIFFDELYLCSIGAPGKSYKSLLNICLRTPLTYLTKKSSKRTTVMSFGVALSAYQREDKFSGIIETALSMFINKEILVQGRIRLLKLNLIVSDNGFMQYIYKTSGAFGAPQSQTCRFCLRTNSEYRLYANVDMINDPKVMRTTSGASFLQIQNQWSIDLLHDYSMGICAYTNFRTLGYLVKVFACCSRTMIVKINSYVPKGESGYFANVLKQDDLDSRFKNKSSINFIKSKGKFNLSGSQQTQLSSCLEKYLYEFKDEITNRCKHVIVILGMCHCKLFKNLHLLHKTVNETFKYLCSFEKTGTEEEIENLKNSINIILNITLETTHPSYALSLKEHILGHYYFLVRKNIPICHLNSSIYESHNGYLKQLMNGCKNGINIGKTVISKAITRDILRLKTKKIEERLIEDHLVLYF